MTDRRTIDYIVETRDKVDRCNICGRTRTLTFDHVPPKATLLSPNVYTSTALSAIPTPDKYMKRYQSGIKYRSICQECNNERLGINDIELAKFTDSIAKELISPKSEDTIVITTKINRVVRAICGHFVAMKMSFDRNNLLDKQIRKILFYDNKMLERIKLYCWFYPFTTVCNARDITTIGKDSRDTHPKGMIGVMASFPLAFMISTKNEAVCGLDDISQYMTSNIDEEIQVALHLNTSTYPGTRMLRHFYWPLNIINGPFSAAAVIGGKAFVEDSRFGVRD